MPVPDNIRGALERYIKNRLEPGSFTRAVLENNLEAVVFADDVSLANLKDIYIYVYNHLPSVAWGSPAAVKDWLSGETQRRYRLEEVEYEG